MHTDDARYTRRSCCVRIEISKNFRLANWLTIKKEKKRERKGEGGRDEYEAFETGETGTFSGFSLEKTFHPRGIHGVDFKPTKESGPNERTENYPDTGDSGREKREERKKYAVSYIFFLSVDQREMKFPVVLGGLP